MGTQEVSAAHQTGSEARPAERSRPGSAVGAVLIACLVLLLLVNVVMLARSVELLRFPGEITEVETAREGALALAAYYEKLASQKGLDKNRAVREALAKFKYELEQALTSDDIGFAISFYGRNVQDVIAREEESKRREIVWLFVSQDARLSQFKGRASVIIEPPGAVGAVRIQDPSDVLLPETESRLKSDPEVQRLTELVEIEVVDGKAALLTTRSLPTQIESLRAEVDKLRSTLQETMRGAGFSEMTGPGLVIRATPDPNAPVNTYYDLRDLINELFAAGATGLEVGGQRMIATSAVRFAGGLILINNQPIATNPIVIKAIGDRQVLKSSLDIIQNYPMFSLKLAIEERDQMTLAAYPVPR